MQVARIRRKVINTFEWGNQLENVHLEDQEGGTFREMGSEDGKLVELVQGRVQWQALVLAVLNVLVLLPQC
jgi:hypothetical protein